MDATPLPKEGVEGLTADDSEFCYLPNGVTS